MNKKKIQQIICIGTLACSMFNIIPTYALDSKAIIQDKNESEYSNKIIKNIELNADSGYMDPTPVIIQSQSFEDLLRDYLGKEADEQIFKSDLDQITYIHIDKEKYPGVEISHLKQLENLNSLAISSANYFNLSSLESFSNIKSLTLGKGNYDLEDIKNTNIKELNLLSNTDVDFSKLTSLNNVECLRISEPYKNSQVGDLTYLSGMQSLKKLDLALVDTSVGRMNEIFKLTELSSLSLMNDGDSTMNIDGIENLTKLESLSLDNFHNNNTFKLNQLSSLKELNISNTKLGDELFDSSTGTNILETINRVKSLTITDGLITDVTPFKNKQYEYLDLSQNYIDLSIPENKLLADNAVFGHLYPQKSLRNIKSDNNLSVGVGETIQLNNVISTLVGDDVEHKITLEDSIEILENRSDKKILNIDKNQMTIEGIEDGTTELIVKIKGLKEGSVGYLKFDVTVESSSVGTGTLNVSCVDENNISIDNISENNISFIPGTYKYYAPYSFKHEIAGDMEKTFTITSGATSNLEFNYNKIITEPCAKITVKHVDAQTGIEIASRDKYEFYEFSTVKVYSVNNIKGYTVKGTYTKDITLTADNNEQTVIFEYESNSNNNNGTNNPSQNPGGGNIDTNNPSQNPGGGNVDTNNPSQNPGGGNVDTNNPSQNPGGDSQKPDNTPTILGSVTINYIDINTGETFKTITKDGLSLSKTHTYSGTVEPGYTLYDKESKTVSLSEEDKDKTIIFKYIKNDKSATFGQERLQEMYDSGAGFTAYTESGSIKANKAFLKYILDNHTEDLKIELSDEISNVNIIDNLSKLYRFNIATKFNLASNLDTSDLEEEVTVSKNIDNKYNNKSVYVYKVLSDDGVEFIGEKIVKDGMISFDTELAKPNNTRASLSSTDYFVTDVKLDASSEINTNTNANENTNVNTNTNTNTNGNTDIDANNTNQNTSTENIPFAGGIGTGITIAGSIGIILASIGLLKKKRK